MNIIQILIINLRIQGFLPLLNPQSHCGNNIIVSHLNHLNHLGEFQLVICVLDLMKGSQVTERIQIPISHLTTENICIVHLAQIIKLTHRLRTHFNPSNCPIEHVPTNHGVEVRIIS